MGLHPWILCGDRSVILYGWRSADAVLVKSMKACMHHWQIMKDVVVTFLQFLPYLIILFLLHMFGNIFEQTCCELNM